MITQLLKNIKKLSTIYFLFTVLKKKYMREKKKIESIGFC
jgi:hypothetical protein